MTPIEHEYAEQGYRLPIGWTWARVAADRAAYRIADIWVPITPGSGLGAWGVPMVGDEFLICSETAKLAARVKSEIEATGDISVTTAAAILRAAI